MNLQETEWITGIGLIGIAISLNIWTLDKVWNFVSALLFLCFSFKCTSWLKWLERSRVISAFGHLSFVVYLLHGPVLFSVSMLIYKWLIGLGLSYFLTVVINLVLSTIIVIAVCEIYYILVEKRIDALVRKI